MIRIAPDTLVDFAAAIVAGSGSSVTEARAVAENLVTANLSGHDSHGVGLLRLYHKARTDGRLTADARLSVVRDSGAILVLDGGCGYGQTIGAQAVDLALDRAREHGLCLFALRDTHHLGRIGAWGERAAAAGFVGIFWVAGFVPALVAPHGGIEARLITNPYCTAFPATDTTPMVVLDMATSKIAMGKTKVALNKGVEVPEGSIIDSAGRESRDPAVMYADRPGALLPMGEHKGFGLALICDLLAGALGGGGTFRPERVDPNSIVNTMLGLVIDPARLGEPSAFRAEIDSAVAWVKSATPRPGFPPVMVAGDPERAARAERSALGVPLDANTWAELVETAHAAGVPEGRIPKV